MKGRRRFYKDVGVANLTPPWESLDQVPSIPLDNPISAGVDGTDSATGVSFQRPTNEYMKSFLRPGDRNTCEWYGVMLDSRPIKTPLGVTLVVPSQNLAMAIAAEWDDQTETISPTQMPLMTLVCTALDQMSVPSARDTTIEQLLNYLKNDTTCYWADPTEDRVLHRHQSKHWNDLHTWVASRQDEGKGKDSGGFGIQPAKAMGAGEGLIMSRIRKSSKNGKKNAGLPHPEELLSQAEEFLKGLDGWSLTAMQAITIEAKSFLIGMAAIRGVLSISEPGNVTCGPFATDTTKIVKASRVEEEFQIENWGLVEGNHDYDRLNCSINVYAALLLVSSIATANSSDDNQ